MRFGSFRQRACGPVTLGLFILFGTGFVGFDLPAADPPELGVSAEQSLQLGLKLEGERRWGDCVRHYELATRKWTDDRLLEQRLRVCRVHADVERRYQDASFLQSLDLASTENALELYSEVLTQLESDYVHQPDWQMLQRHGTAFLEVALTEPLFLKKHLANANPTDVEEFRLHVHEYVGAQPLRTRFDLRANAAYVAGLARQKLGLSGTATVMEYVCGAVGLLDPYTRFLTRQQLDETLSNIEGNFVGLGVELKCEPDSLRIVSVIQGGPAADAGIQRGDRILAVDEAQVGPHPPESVADMLRGPASSWLRVTLLRTNGATQSLTLQRRMVEVPCVENVHLADPEAGVGYLRLTTFQKTTVTDLDRALWDLQRQGMRSLIIDLRGNPGGLLQAAIDVADRFLADGKIVTTHGRKASENFEYRAHRAGTWGVPLVLLIDRDSASASEVFAGAILDNNRGRLIGEKSYGKGSVQGIFAMHTGGAGLCMTTAKFYSPNGHEISNHGVRPHEEVLEPNTDEIGPELFASRVDPLADGAVTVLKPDSSQVAPPSDAAPEVARDVALERAVTVARQSVARVPQQSTATPPAFAQRSP